MKITQFLALLRNDARWIWSAFIFSVFICVQSASLLRTDNMFSLSFGSNGTDIFILMIPSMSMGIFFLSGGYGTRTTTVVPMGTLEFFFSKAISRTAMFCSKSLIFLALIFLPLSILWVYSHIKPTVRIELPYNSKGDREDTKQFYLQHFEGAYVQKDEKDREGKKVYVVLPQGKTQIAAFTLFWGFASTLVFEAMIMTFQASRFGYLLIFPSFLIFMVVMGWPSSHTPSRYEANLAFVSQYPLLAFLGLGLLTALTQLYCCRRFINTEIT